VLERKAPPTFDVVIELLDFDRLAVHHNVQKTVDLMLRGLAPRPEIRVRSGGQVEVVQRDELVDVDEPGFNERFPSLAPRRDESDGYDRPARGDRDGGSRREPRESREPREPREREIKNPKGNVVRIFPYGIARTRLERAIREKKAPAYITNDITQADAVIAIRTTMMNKPTKLRELNRPVPTVVIKSNTFTQIANAVEEIVRGGVQDKDRETAAIDEANQAITQVLQSGKPFELSPQDARTRKMQHQLVEAKRLASESVGADPNRRLRILPIRLA